MINKDINKKLPEIKQLLKQHKVKNAYLFGSACSVQFNDKSDIDLLIEFEDGLSPVERGENWWNLYYALKNILHRNVDLVTSSSLRNPFFILEVNSSKQLIYGS